MKNCINCPGSTDHSTAECPLLRLVVQENRRPAPKSFAQLMDELASWRRHQEKLRRPAMSLKAKGTADSIKIIRNDSLPDNVMMVGKALYEQMNKGLSQ